MSKTLVNTSTKLIPEIRDALNAQGATRIRSISRELASDARGIRFEQTEITTVVGNRNHTVLLLISPAPKGAEARMKAMLAHSRANGAPPVFEACTPALDGLEIRVAGYALPGRLRAEVRRAVGALFGEK
jgi:hypothetical protein